MDTIENALRQWLETASKGPPHPAREFIRGGASVETVYRMAGDLQRRFNDGGDDMRRVCLCTADRALVAAAILASLDGKTQLLLPHAFSTAALKALHEQSGYTAAIADDAGALPRGVTDITPAVVPVAPLLPVIDIAVDADWAWLFTGGSTGSPRIWPKSPLGLLGEALFQAHHHGIGPADTILATVFPLHIFGLIFSVLIPLVASAAVVPGTPVFPAEITKKIDRYGATVLISVPAHYRTLGNRPPFGGALRKAFSSACPLRPKDGAAFVQRTGVPVVEIYGSTETGGIATICRANGETDYAPFPVIDWRIDDGRLSVRSEFLSAALPTDEQGFFQTADRVSHGGDGHFILGGRIDGVVKVGGKRVDLHVTHEALMAVSGVANAFVLTVPAGDGRETAIVAVVQTDLKRETIMGRLAPVLEPHEIPRRLYVVDHLPLTDVGKVDRAAVMRLMSNAGQQGSGRD